MVVVPVSLAGLAVFGLAVAGGVGVLASAALLLLVAAILAEAFPVRIEGVAAGATSFANLFIVAAAVLYGWRAAVLIGALTMLVVEVHTRKSALQLVFNSSLYVLGGAAAGLIAQAITVQYLRAVVAALAFYAIDVALLAAVVASSRRDRLVHVARSFYLSTLAPCVVMASMTVILVRLWEDSPYDMLLLVPPLVAIVAYQRSLVAAVTRQRELDELKNEFIAVVSHELRTPLTSVYGSAVTLEEHHLDEAMRGRLIGIICRESARLAKLVEDILWASRLDAKKKSRELKECDPVALARDVVSVAAEIAPDEIRVIITADTDVPVLVANEDELRRVLANLVDNAVKYSPEGGTVEVAARMAGENLRFTVKDEGIGVPEEERERIFGKFFRLDPQMRTGVSGTGLGLYICRELVEQMGGRIWVNANEGRGSSFVFELPASTGRRSPMVRKLVMLVVLVAALCALAVVGAGWKWPGWSNAAPSSYQPAPDGWTWDPGIEG